MDQKKHKKMRQTITKARLAWKQTKHLWMLWIDFQLRHVLCMHIDKLCKIIIDLICVIPVFILYEIEPLNMFLLTFSTRIVCTSFVCQTTLHIFPFPIHLQTNHMIWYWKCAPWWNKEQNTHFNINVFQHFFKYRHRLQGGGKKIDTHINTWRKRRISNDNLCKVVWSWESYSFVFFKVYFSVV